MSNAKSELFTFLAAAFATLVGLFVLHQAYGSFIDVRYHERIQDGGPSEELLQTREADEAQLQSGKMPLDQAMARLGRNRSHIGSIAPQRSEDLSAVSGWIHMPGFKPAVAFPTYVARPPVATPPKATEPPAATAPAAEQAQPAAAAEARAGAKAAAGKGARPKAQK